MTCAHNSFSTVFLDSWLYTGQSSFGKMMHSRKRAVPSLSVLCCCLPESEKWADSILTVTTFDHLFWSPLSNIYSWGTIFPFPAVVLPSIYQWVWCLWTDVYSKGYDLSDVYQCHELSYIRHPHELFCTWWPAVKSNVSSVCSVADIILQHSNFVGVPVFLNGKKINTTQVCSYSTQILLPFLLTGLDFTTHIHGKVSGSCAETLNKPTENVAVCVKLLH